MKDVSCFFNRVNFFEKINGDLVEEMRCIKRQLLIEFGEYTMATMVYASDIIDEMIVSLITKEIKDYIEKKLLLPRKKLFF